MFRKIKHITITSIIWIILSHNLSAQQFSENEVKAAFICNFTKFVEWPENTFTSGTSPIVIGFLNDSVLASIAKRMASAIKANGRAIQIVEYKNIDEITRCHILYINPFAGNISAVINRFSGIPVLTVSETEGFCKQKGMINFSKKKTKFGFEINDKSAREAGLKISSKLLGLATIIE